MSEAGHAPERSDKELADSLTDDELRRRIAAIKEANGGLWVHVTDRDVFLAGALWMKQQTADQSR